MAKPVALKPIYTNTRKRVAIVGAGPAGLTVARELALLGHTATVFEKHAEPEHGRTQQRRNEEIEAVKKPELGELGQIWNET